MTTPKLLHEVIQDVITADPGISPVRLAAYICDAYTIRTPEELAAAPHGALVVDSDRDVYAKDTRGWYLTGDPDVEDEGAEITLPALLMPWEWQGEDDQLRAVYVPTSATARETRSPGVADVERFTATVGFARAQMYREAAASVALDRDETWTVGGGNG